MGLEGKTFIEPCAGDGRLVDHLESLGMRCLGAYDIEPQSDRVVHKDAFHITAEDLNGADLIITNPPWDRKILHGLMAHFASMVPSWLLFDADWMHTKQAVPYLPACGHIVSVGRVKWIEGSKSVGKDNCAWYGFGGHSGPTVFHGKQVEGINR
jgi:DNA modification methylase